MTLENEGVSAAGGYGPPGGGGYGGPPGGPPPGGGYGGPPGGAPPGGYGPPPGGGGAPPGGYGAPPGGFGAPPPGFGPPGFGALGPKIHPLAITSLVLGILSVPLCCCSFLGAWAPIGAVVCGIIGLNKIKEAPQVFKGNGLCIAGIVTGGIGLLLDAVAILSSVDESLREQYGHF